MSRTITPRLTNALVPRRGACKALGISPRSFWRHWHAVFTETRDEAGRRKGVDRKVFEDELAVAVNSGGSPAAVINYRGRVGRT